MKKIRFTLTLSLSLLIILTGATCNKKLADGGIFKSEDQAESWEQKTYIGQKDKKIISISNTNIRSITFDPIDPNIVYVTTYENGIYKTYNGGDNWEPFAFSSGYYRDLEIDPQNPQNIYICKDNNILRSVDGGENWETVYTDTKGGDIMQIIVDHYNPRIIYAFTTVSTVLKSEDYGVNWSLINQLQSFTREAVMNPQDSRILYLRDDEGNLYKTTDGAYNWEIITQNKDYQKQFPKAKSIKSLALDPNNPQILYTSSKQGLLKTTDGGTTWKKINTLIPDDNKYNEKIKNITVAPGNSEIIYFTVGRLIHKTTDGGTTWKTIEDFPSQREIVLLYADPSNSYTLYAGTKKIEEKKKGIISL